MASEEGAHKHDAGLFSRGGFLHRLACGFSYGVWYIDAEGRTVFANDALAAMLGCTPEEMSGTRLEEFLFPDERDTIMNAIRNKAIVRGRSRRLSLRRGDDVSRWFRMEVVPTDSPPDGPPGAMVLLSETTNQRHGEEASAYLSSLIATSEDAIYGVDLGNVITSWNRGAERMFGYSAAEIVGQSIRVLVLEELQEEEDRILELLRRGERVEQFLTVRWHKDGRLIDVFVTASPILDADGQVVGIAKLARDVTERMAERREQGRRNAELERRIQERTAEVEALRNELKFAS